MIMRSVMLKLFKKIIKSVVYIHTFISVQFPLHFIILSISQLLLLLLLLWLIKPCPVVIMI